MRPGFDWYNQTGDTCGFGRRRNAWWVTVRASDMPGLLGSTTNNTNTQSWSSVSDANSWTSSDPLTPEVLSNAMRLLNGPTADTNTPEFAKPLAPLADWMQRADELLNGR